MPSKTVKSRSRCLLCNCLSHSTERCNSNMNGRRALLQNICKDMMYDDKLMMDDKMPDFNSFPINELRYIILAYQGTLKNIMFPRTNYHPEIIKLMRTPIPLTLPKTRMIKELAIRWHYFQPVRQLKKMKPADGVDCPICMLCLRVIRFVLNADMNFVVTAGNHTTKQTIELTIVTADQMIEHIYLALCVVIAWSARIYVFIEK